MVTRRDFFVGGSAAVAAYAAGSFLPLGAQSSPNLGAPSVVQVGFRKQKVGDIEVIALNDGVTRRPLAAEFVRNAPLGEVQELLRSQNLPTEYLDVPYTAFLVISGNRKVLMDTGFSDNGGPTTGWLHRTGHRHRAAQPLPWRSHSGRAKQGRPTGVPQRQDHGSLGGTCLLDGRRPHGSRA